MKAVIYEEKGKLSLGERPVPRILEKTDAIVRVTLASICTSDLHIKHGAVPSPEWSWGTRWLEWSRASGTV